MTSVSSTRIRILDGETVNQIAAGEVVERPASIVKELIENAIDAGAAQITVEISSSRKEVSRIRIIDDGHGIPAGEVPLAFLPHATSKIQTAEDLNTCRTLGFRGEALASIAAIAYVTMVTRPQGEEAGTRVIISGGEVLEQGAIGAPVGTTLTIEEIFFTTPARRKFLKSLATELSRLSSVIEVFCLFYPEITFRYLLNGQEKITSHGTRTLGEVLRALRPDEAVQMLSIKGEDHGISLEGYISHPELIKQNTQRILIAVNGRMIVSSRISGAIRGGYGTLIPSYSFPVAVLVITLDPARVDANIHPTKREIRISDESEFLKFITSTVKETLQRNDLSHSVSVTERSELIQSPDTQMSDSVSSEYHVRMSPLPGVHEASLAGYRTTARQLRQSRLQMEPADSAGEPRFPSLTYIGQVAATYLLASNEAGDLILIDQHAAHERVRYDQLKREQREGTLSQELLVPVVLSFSPSEVHLLTELKSDLEEEGFHIEPFGKDTWCVRGVPVVLGRSEDPEAIKEIISGILTGGQESRMHESVSRLVACRGAVKAGVILTPEQGEEIISQLSYTAEPYTCPHGRPTIVSFSRVKLEELFRRR
ncbi:MAG: DNA mismatch repair endonuclease MutL [Methanospirillum sp.]|uniref:DNA mismatch repair endonuclease MutL n=1 Tax=Methanospirillum sp. TaxID=45200 RepID=UPI00237312FC|nr:DNA mismatch repair endonuclease MutL [Methanospirillum sp.]MDD1729477.1 DNA mismatch repair endonuclease MutL [Methanospirillum sp.]